MPTDHRFVPPAVPCSTVPISGDAEGVANGGRSMKRFMKYLVPMAALVMAIAFVAGCSKNPVEPKKSDLDSVAKPQPVAESSAPTLSGYRMVKSVGISQIYDRNEGDYDYLITFDLPVSYCPSSWRVLAMTWYGVWYDESIYLQPYGFSANGNGTYRMRFLFGKGKARAFGIAMSPSNWALYFR